MTATDQLARALGALIDAGDKLAEIPRLREAVDALRSEARAAALLAISEEALHPDYVYTFEQAERLTGRTRKTLSNQPEAVLPAMRSRGRAIGFRGIDLMAYRGDVSHEEARAYKAAQREAVQRVIASNRAGN